MVVEWIIVAILVVLGLFYVSLEHHAKRIKIVVIIIIGFLLYFSIANVLKSNDVDLTSPKGIMNGASLYASWVGRTASSLWGIGVDTTHLVGNAIKGNVTREK